MRRKVFLLVVRKESDYLCAKTVGTSGVSWHHKHVAASLLKFIMVIRGGVASKFNVVRLFVMCEHNNLEFEGEGCWNDNAGGEFNHAPI